MLWDDQGSGPAELGEGRGLARPAQDVVLQPGVALGERQEPGRDLSQVALPGSHGRSVGPEPFEHPGTRQRVEALRRLDMVTDRRCGHAEVRHHGRSSAAPPRSPS